MTISKTNSKRNGIVFLLAALTLAVFAQVLWHQFVFYGDTLTVTDNPFVKEGLHKQGIRWALLRSFEGSWIPMTRLSHMLTVSVFGLHPSGHHAVNLFLHFSNVILLFLIFFQLTGDAWKSCILAAFFAIHPLQVETVAWISERKDLLSAFFFLSALWVYVDYCRERSAIRYILSVILFALGILSEPMIVMLPFILLALDYWPLQRFNAKAVSEKAAFFILSAASMVVTAYAQLAGKAQTFCNISFRITSGDNVFIPYANYLLKALWPAGLAIFYAPLQQNISPAVVIIHIFFLCLVSGFVIYKRKKIPYLFVGWFWYVLMLMPVLGLAQGGEYAMADHYVYLPLIGLSLVAAWGITDLFKKFKLGHLLASGFILMILLLSFLSLWQTGYWAKSETLFARALKVTPDNPIAHTIFGRALFFEGNMEGAQTQFNQALAFHPEDSFAHHGLAMIYTEKKNYDKAIFHLSKALKMELNYPKSYDHLGSFFEERGRGDEAMKQYEKAISLNPNYLDARLHLAELLAKKGKRGEALHHFKEALRLDPHNFRAQEEMDRITSMKKKT